MDIGNVLNNCQGVLGNTGTGQCFFDLETVGGVIFVPKGMTFDTTSLANLQTALTTALTANSARARIFPVNNIIDCKPNSEKVVIQTSNTGAKKVVRDVYDQLDLSWWDGGFCLLYQLRKGNGLNNPFLLYTINGLLIGVNAGEGLIKGIVPTLAWANAMGWSDGTKSADYMITLNWNAKQTNDNVKIVDFGPVGGQVYLDSLTGIETINLIKQARVVALLTVGLRLACGGVDLFPTYPTQLVANKWVAYADTSGAANLAKPIAITSATPTADGYAIQIDVTDTNYTAGAPIWLGLVGPATLLSGGIGGADGNSGFEAPLVSIGL